jgi:Ca-activated chloride channel family protein
MSDEAAAMSVAGVRRRPLAVTLLGLLGLVGSLGGQAVAASADSATAVVLVIDASGTMGKTDVAPDRMTAAKAAAHTVIGAADTPAMGLLTYGTSTQRIALLDGVDALTPSGYTPIGLAIQRAAEAVGGRGSVVLISDGEDTCAPPDPCQVARDLKQQHPDLSISTIGFRTDQAARSQLACIASATGGLFVSADDPSQLTRRLGVATEAATGTVPLTTTGFGGIEIGRTHAEITLDHPDFPGRSAAKRYVGPVPGDLVVIRYRDCDFVFDQSGTLLAVQPTQATTVDSVGVDDTVALAVATYGPPLSTGDADSGDRAVSVRPAVDPVGADRHLDR